MADADAGQTRIPLASNSKLVTVLATAQALKLKGFPLGHKTRVKDVHPGFELKNKVMEAEATFEDVFCHRLRLPANNYHLSRPLAEGETVVSAAAGPLLSDPHSNRSASPSRR
jgi:hypothetical protein